jgi:hypothetical protein
VEQGRKELEVRVRRLRGDNRTLLHREIMPATALRAPLGERSLNANDHVTVLLGEVFEQIRMNARRKDL